VSLNCNLQLRFNDIWSTYFFTHVQYRKGLICTGWFDVILTCLAIASLISSHAVTCIFIYTVYTGSSIQAWVGGTFVNVWIQTSSIWQSVCCYIEHLNLYHDHCTTAMEYIFTHMYFIAPYTTRTYPKVSIWHRYRFVIDVTTQRSCQQKRSNTELIACK